jgi:hypothetical protein
LVLHEDTNIYTCFGFFLNFGKLIWIFLLKSVFKKSVKKSHPDNKNSHVLVLKKFSEKTRLGGSGKRREREKRKR